MLKANVCASCRLDPATVDHDVDVGLCGGTGADLCSTFGDNERGRLRCFSSQNKINLKP